MKCDFCDSEGECFDLCNCSKCIDLELYEEWKCEFPEEYEEWLDKKREEEP